MRTGGKRLLANDDKKSGRETLIVTIGETSNVKFQDLTFEVSCLQFFHRH